MMYGVGKKKLGRGGGLRLHPNPSVAQTSPPLHGPTPSPLCFVDPCVCVSLGMVTAACKRLRLLGVDVAPATPWDITGFSLPHGPHVVLHPNLGAVIATLRPHFPTPADVRIQAGSTVVLEGKDITVHSLDVKGALVVEAVDGAHVGALAWASRCRPPLHFSL